ncbi:MAG: hypothetical protein ACK5SM_00975 [Sphingomonadales bacterium]
MNEDKSSPLVVALSAGTAALFGLCAVLLAAAIVGVGAAIVFRADEDAKPRQVELRRPRGEVKSAEAELGPVNKAALNEIKDCWAVNRFRARRARFQTQPSYPNYQPAPYIEPAYPQVGPTPYPNPEPVILPQEEVPMVPVPVMPESSCPDGRCPRPVQLLGEVKTGGLKCASCNRETIGQQWHTDWIDGVPSTSVCERCYQGGAKLLVGNYPSR